MTLATTFNRFIKITANFKDLALRAQNQQLVRLKRIKKKYERNLARQNSLPMELPRINWEYYRENLSAEHHGLIAEYEKKYKEFKIPLPQHEITSKFNKLKVEYAVDVENYKNESNGRIKIYDDALKLYKALMPYEQMTMEDFSCLFSKEAPDYINRPTFWPHYPEDQLGYVKPALTVSRKESVHDRKEKIPIRPKDHPSSIKGKVSKAIAKQKQPKHGK